jgi:hypothetical protein
MPPFAIGDLSALCGALGCLGTPDAVQVDQRRDTRKRSELRNWRIEKNAQKPLAPQFDSNHQYGCDAHRNSVTQDKDHTHFRKL